MKLNDEIKEILELIGNSYYYGNIAEEQKEKYCNYITNLQERIDKATEYINENWGHWCSDHCKYATETISILKGESNDKEL